DLKETVTEIGVRGDRREHLGALVPDEVRPRRAAEARLVPRRPALPRDLAVPLHQARVLLVVHAEAALARELLRQLDREAVRRLEIERVVAGDLALRRGLLEDRHAALERLAEALLLGGERAEDL